MTTKKREDREGRNALNVPAQEDEADIVAEVGAEQDEETGELEADIEKVRELGALDPASVRQNRHINRVADKKRKGEKVSFGIDDPIVLYEALNRVWTNDKVDVHVQNLVTRELHIIRSHPRSGADLYELLRGIHGPREAQEYKIEFRSASRKEYLGLARLTMPDARPSGPQGQPPPQYAPQAAPQAPTFSQPPHGTDPMQMVQQVLDVAERLRVQMTPAAAQPTPTAPAFVMPQPGNDPMQTVQQVLDIAERLRAQMTPSQAPLPPPPPASSDPTALLNWALQAVQRLQPAPQVVQPQPQAAGPVGMPPFPAPPGTTWMYAPGPNGSLGGWIAQPLAQALGAGGPPQQRSPFQRPPYYPQGDPRGVPPYAQQRQPERSPIQAFRESVSTMRDMRNIAQEFTDVFGGGGSPEPVEVAEDDDDSPIKIIETGHGKLAVNRSDGALRWAETGLMLLPDVLKWVGEQHDKIQTAQRQKQQPPPRRVLAPGYVEVDQNYKPPPGYVAVPVEQDLPEPPSNVPPAIDDREQEEEPRQAWGAPVIPQNG